MRLKKWTLVLTAALLLFGSSVAHAAEVTEEKGREVKETEELEQLEQEKPEGGESDKENREEGDGKQDDIEEGDGKKDEAEEEDGKKDETEEGDEKKDDIEEGDGKKDETEGEEDKKDKDDDNTEKPPASPEYGSIHSAQFDGATIRPGIDVSKWNGDIDWKEVAKTQDFAFIRVAGRYSGSGEIYLDEYYEENIKEAYAAGLDIGVYFLSQAITTAEAKEEAKFLLKKISKYQKMITLPIVCDYEYVGNGRLTQAKLTKAEHTSIVNKFCSTIEKAGYTACLYTNLVMIKNNYNIEKINNKYALWIARYNTQVSVGSLTYDGPYIFWQYSSSGSVDGIKGRVDLDHQYVMKPAKVTGLSAQSDTPGAISLTWKKRVGVYGYQIFRTEAGGEEFTKIATVRGASMTTYTDTTAEQGIEYDYRVRAFYKFQKGNKAGSYSDRVLAASQIILDPVQNITETASTVSTITFTWDAPKQANGYEIYRYDKSSDKYIKIATISKRKTTTYTDEGLKEGKKYDYRIRPFFKTNGGNFIYYGPYETISLYSRLSAVSGVEAVERTTNSVTLSWDAVKYAKGYVILQYDAKADKYKKVAEVSGKKTTSYQVTKLKANHSYQFKICAYRSFGETKLRGTRSAALEVRTKKK